MKKIILSMLMLLSIAANAQVINGDLWDGTFTYNRLTSELVGDHLVLKMEGATIMPVSEDDHWGQSEKVLVLPRENCKIDTEEKVFRCFMNETMLKLSEYVGGKWVTREPKNLTLLSINLVNVIEAGTTNPQFIIFIDYTLDDHPLHQSIHFR